VPDEPTRYLNSGAASATVIEECEANHAPLGAYSDSKPPAADPPAFQVIRRNGDAVAFNPEKIALAISKAFLSVASALIRRLPAGGAVHIEAIQDQVELALILSARSLIEREPRYNYATARLLLDSIRAEVLGESAGHAAMPTDYPAYFSDYIKRGIEAGLLDRRLAQFDLARLSRALAAERDLKFGYLGLQTLYDRYFLHIEERRIELPQIFFMRVAMGLALNEIDRVPAELKTLYATAFEIDPVWLVEAAARRQKWIDQAQSLNLYFAVPSGKKLHDTYLLAWRRGLKTTYYLRSLGATSAEKSTGLGGELNAVPSIPATKQCSIDDPGCEACQ
jgi:ribonucleotide reductase alpha subunit